MDRKTNLTRSCEKSKGDIIFAANGWRGTQTAAGKTPRIRTRNYARLVGCLRLRVKMALTLDEPALKRMFPRCSRSFLEANVAGVSDAQPKRDSSQTLDGSISSKENGKERAVVRIVRHACRLLDEDNLKGGVKPLLDCLKEAGLIEDDSPSAIELDVRQEKVFNKDHERTELEIIWPD